MDMAVKEILFRFMFRLPENRGHESGEPVDFLAVINLTAAWLRWNSGRKILTPGQKVQLKNDFDAVISTGWTRIASATPPTEPHEVLWFNIIYAAESMWNGTPRDLNDFIKSASLQLYGCVLPDLSTWHSL